MQCKGLSDTVGELSFSFDGPTEMLQNLFHVMEIYQKVKPAWHGCWSLSSEMGKLRGAFEILSSPAQYGMYGLMAKTIGSWEDVY
jgi:hypothetical protein